MSAIKPLGSHVLIRRSDASEVSTGGIILPEAAKEQPKEGKVIAVGAGKVVDDGSRHSFQVSEGDRVIFSSYAGTEVEHEGETLMLMDESDILAIVK